MAAVRVSSFALEFSATKIHTAFKPYLRKHLLAAHGMINPPLRELSIALVGDKKMADLHQQFLGIAGPTDVLTFPLEVDRKGRPVSGEAVICVSEARRRSVHNGNLLRAELLLYSLHGMLHLCGHDDKTDRGFARMHRMEDDILSRLGVGPVFDAESKFPAMKRKKR